MKKRFVIHLCLVLMAVSLSAQTRTAQNNISAGGGFEQYNGDLGNSFFDFEEEWYGFYSLSYSRYLNRSLDVKASATIGDIGRCFDGVLAPGEHILMLRSRMTTVGLGVKYKFANGYILKEYSRLAPYVYAGATLVNHRDVWLHEPRVNEGFYTSLNGGMGISYYLARNLQFTYNLGLGYFTSDALDFISKGGNDMYLQNTFSLGMSF